MAHFHASTHISRCGSRSAAPESGGWAPQRLPAPTHEEIAELAYSYWEARGRQGGSPLEDWLRAERELTESRRRA